jgi:hypothetical protein
MKYKNIRFPCPILPFFTPTTMKLFKYILVILNLGKQKYQKIKHKNVIKLEQKYDEILMQSNIVDD